MATTGHTPQEVAAVRRMTSDVLATFLREWLAGLREVGRDPAPWAAKWLALRLTCQKELEQREASDEPPDIVIVEALREVLAGMRHLDGLYDGHRKRYRQLLAGLERVAARAERRAAHR